MLKCLFEKINRTVLVLALLAGGAVLVSCQSQEPTFQPPPVPGYDTSAAASAKPLAATNSAAATNSPSQVLREGNTIKITFPGAPSLDTSQAIRQDGKITLDMVGEIKAAGMTPQELEKQLLKAYSAYLVTKEVSVTVVGAAFEVYVTGAVLKPGKIVSDRVLTPLEAVLEAGVDFNKANLEKVKIIREGADGKTQEYQLDLKAVLKGKPAKPFTLMPFDKIWVPEKFLFY